MIEQEKRVKGRIASFLREDRKALFMREMHTFSFIEFQQNKFIKLITSGEVHTGNIGFVLIGLTAGTVVGNFLNYHLFNIKETHSSFCFSLMNGEKINIYALIKFDKTFFGVKISRDEK